MVTFFIKSVSLFLGGKECFKVNFAQESCRIFLLARKDAITMKVLIPLGFMTNLHP